MSKGTISLCVIAKNEELNISRCLSSCAHIVEEIIVVDTGSTDNTIKIAKSLGAKIIEFPWCNNFSKARNTAVDAATCEWILYLDCDEVLDFEGAMTLKETLESEDVEEGKNEGFCFNLINIIENAKTMNYPSLRMFRNRKEYRFEGRIHEQIFPSISKYYNSDSIVTLDIDIYHYGYDSSINDIEGKKRRNIEIFNSYDESEKDGFFYYNLANEYTRAGNTEEALKYYILAKETPAFDNGFKLFLPIYLVKAHYDLKNYSSAVKVGLEYLEHYPNYKDLNFLVAVCYYEQKLYKESKEYLLRYITYSKENYGYPEFYLDRYNNVNDIMAEIETHISAAPN